MVSGVRRSALWQRLLGSDRNMRIRVATTGVSALVSIVYGALVVLLAETGFVARTDIALVWVAAIVLFNIGVLVAIRTGRTCDLADPALTQLQIRFAMVSTAVGYVLLGEARGITPAILSPVLMFGVFSLSARQIKGNFLFALISFSLAMAVTARITADSYRAVLELAYGVMFVLVLAGSTFIGLRIQKVRSTLQRQKHALGDALKRINHLATHDEMTGLINRRRMTELVEVERERCERSGRPLLVALLDLDFFKAVNDRHGHAAGDTVLRAFAARGIACVRNTDVLARWGGEEFLLLLPESSVEGALTLLERLRGEIAALRIEIASGEIRVTVSVGLAAGRRGQTLEQVLEQADEALYQAKEHGRDRVVVHGDSQWAELLDGD